MPTKNQKKIQNYSKNYTANTKNLKFLFRLECFSMDHQEQEKPLLQKNWQKKLNVDSSQNMGEFGSSYLHQTTKNIKDFFDGVKKIAENEPIILFLDEIDSLLSARTNNVDSNKAEEVSQFLQEFNALEEAKNLIVIAATNRPDHLDSAILRSGRLDKKIYIGPPDETAREELFHMYIEKIGRPHEKLDYHELAILTTNYVSADIEAICDEVARDASKQKVENSPENTLKTTKSR